MTSYGLAACSVFTLHELLAVRVYVVGRHILI